MIVTAIWILLPPGLERFSATERTPQRARGAAPGSQWIGESFSWAWSVAPTAKGASPKRKTDRGHHDILYQYLGADARAASAWLAGLRP